MRERHGQPTAGETLATLHKQNYFTNKQAADREPTYEYHPLFREFLLSQALRVYHSEALAKIRRTAGGLLDAAGRVEAAAELFRDAEDWDGLTQLIHRHAQSLLAQGRAQTLQEWLHGIPPRVFTEQPWLLFWRGIGWIGGDTRLPARPADAFTAFRRDGDTLMFLAWSGLIFAYLGEGELVHGPLDRALRRDHAGPPPFPSRGVETRVAGAMLVARRAAAKPSAGGALGRTGDRAGARAPGCGAQDETAVNWLHYQRRR